MTEIDAIQLHFNPTSLKLLSAMLAVVMFGVALDMRWDNFKQVLKFPIAFAIGLFCQYAILPAIGFITAWLLGAPPSIALGVLLICCCPGGNVSNFFTYQSGGNAALSVSMSSVSTLACIVMTPLNFSLWASLRPDTLALLQTIHISPLQILVQVSIILLLPCALGMWLRASNAPLAGKIRKPINLFSLLLFVGFIVAGLIANFATFINYIGSTFWVVVIVNALGLASGYYLARLAGLSVYDRKAVSFEVGIQNSGFGLILCLAFFSNL